MAETQIEKLKRILRTKSGASATPVDVKRRREDMELMSFKAKDDIDVESVTVSEMAAEWVRAPECRVDRAILYLHGGGYVVGSPATHRSLAGEISRVSQAPALVIDYRLAPESPFPAAVEDGVRAYRWMLAQGYEPNQLAIAGDSAGGGLTVATLVAARDAGLPMPRSAVCISPWSDMTCSNPSYKTRAEADPMITPAGIAHMASLYLGGAEATDPLASPNYADLSGLPALLIHVGSDEILVDDATTLDANARAAGVASTLEVWDDMIHVWHAFHPMLEEGKQGIARVGLFLTQQWESS